MTLLGIEMTLSNDELLKIISLFGSYFITNNHYDIFEFLLNYITLNDKTAYDSIIKILNRFKTPTTKELQKIQLKIYEKLILFPSVKRFKK